MEVEYFCPFLNVCGPASISQLMAKQKFSFGDPRRDHITTVCGQKDRYSACEYYQIRVKSKEAVKEAEKNETV